MLKILLKFVVNDDTTKDALLVAEQAHDCAGGNGDGSVESLPFTGTVRTAAAMLTFQVIAVEAKCERTLLNVNPLYTLTFNNCMGERSG